MALGVLLLLFLVTVVGCDGTGEAERSSSQPQNHYRVAVTNYPLYCFVSAICEIPNGPVKEVVYVGPTRGTDPHSWMPSTDQIRDLQKVDLIVCNGPGAVFANWMDKVTIDESKLCITTDAIDLREFVVVKDYQLVHSHGPEGEHSHSWVVPQSWLSPRIARKQATLCYNQLIAKYGESSELDRGFALLQKQFDGLEAVVEKIRTTHPGLTVASSTPDIQYLTRELGWTDHYLQWTEPRDVDLAEKELSEMRARYVKAESKSAVEKVFLWSGRGEDSLSDFVESQWPASTTVDLIDTPTDGENGADGYFRRMSENLTRIADQLN